MDKLPTNSHALVVTSSELFNLPFHSDCYLTALPPMPPTPLTPDCPTPRQHLRRFRDGGRRTRQENRQKISRHRQTSTRRLPVHRLLWNAMRSRRRPRPPNEVTPTSPQRPKFTTQLRANTPVGPST